MSTRARAEKRAAQLLSSNTAPSLASCLWSCLAKVFSSIVPAESNRYTWTGLVWPSRQTRAMACSSCAGFQSGSNRSKRLPPTRFRPQPPARVDNKNTNAFEVLDLKRSTNLGRSAGGVVPSTRSQSHLLLSQQAWMTSNVAVLPDAITTLSDPVSRRCWRREKATRNLPLEGSCSG